MESLFHDTLEKIILLEDGKCFESTLKQQLEKEITNNLEKLWLLSDETKGWFRKISALSRRYKTTLAYLESLNSQV